jgi:hypothetical protein
MAHEWQRGKGVGVGEKDIYITHTYLITYNGVNLFKIYCTLLWNDKTPLYYVC